MYIFEERAIGSEVIMLNASLIVAKFLVSWRNFAFGCFSGTSTNQCLEQLSVKPGFH